MKLVSTTPQKIEKSELWLVGIAQDSNKYYGAIVNPRTWQCYVEEIGVSVSKEDLTGYFIRIPEGKNDMEWKTVTSFFEKHQVFGKFLEGRNWIFATKEGKLTDNAVKARNKILNGIGS